MKKNETQIVELDVEQLIPAEWNYKTDGTDEEIAKLAASIDKDKSAGVFAVREVQLDGKLMFEVMDGNHRLAAVKLLDWKKVPCENFGDITVGYAATIARRRNHKWFDDDIYKMQKLFKEEVFKDFEIDELESFMPDSRGFLESMKEISDLPWDRIKEDSENGVEPPTDFSGEPGDEQSFTELKIKIPTETLNVWHDLKERLGRVLGEEQPDYRVLEFALIEALNIPEESLVRTIEESVQ